MHTVNLTISKNLTLDAEDPTAATGIDGGGSDPTVLVEAKRRLVIRNLEVFNGDGGGNWAGGIEAADAADLLIENCDIHDNTGMIGGIQAPYNGTANLVDVVVRDNTGDYAGGMGIGTGGLTTVEISGNHATLRGGGLWVYPFQGPDNTDVVVTGNHSDGLGGGIALDWGSSWEGGVIENNTATEGGGIGLINASTVVISDAWVQNNSATVAGGGFFNGLTIGGAMAIYDTTFSSNSAPSGGGLYIQQTTDGVSSMTLDGLTIDANDADHGAGITLSGIDLTLTNGVLAGNTAALSGGGLTLLNDATVTATDVDVGTGLGGNAPEDVDVDGMTYEYDGTVGFTCTDTCI